MYMNVPCSYVASCKVTIMLKRYGQIYTTKMPSVTKIRLTVSEMKLANR